MGMRRGDDPGADPIELAGIAEAAVLDVPATNLTKQVVSSTTALLLRSAWERMLSLVATLAIARLLLPKDMGEATLVLVTIAFATILVDGGMTTALVRSPEEPTKARFETVRRVQLVLAATAVALCAAVMAFNAGLGLLLFVDSLQLLVDPWMVQPRVLLQRRIDFRGLALADGIGVVVRSVVSLGIAFVHRGPACLVLGDVTAAFTYAGIVVRALKSPPVSRPDVVDDVSAIGGALRNLREGLSFQLFTLTLSLRDLSTSALIGGLAGLRALGLFQFAARALSPVQLVFTSLNQLAIPIGVHVVGGSPAVHKQVRQGYLLGGLANAAILATAATPAPWLIPMVFGRRWSGAVPLLFALALNMVLTGPAGSLGIGLVLAAGRTGFATLAAAACTGFFLVVLFALSHFGSLSALAIAWVVSGTVETAIVLYACMRFIRISLISPTLAPIPIFLASFLAGRLAGHALPGGWPSAVVAATVAVASSLVLSFPLAWGPSQDLLRAARRPVEQGSFA